MSDYQPTDHSLDQVIHLPADPPSAFGRQFAPRQKFQDRRWLHLALLGLTFLSTTAVGADHYRFFQLDFSQARVSYLSDWLHGLWYSGTILLILGAHEMGHYLACRRYQVDASLPFFIPMPLLLTGTLGAFIRIREPIPTKRMLFDIGAGGPFAGFVFAVPALFVGLALSNVTKAMTVVPKDVVSFDLGEPLLYKAAAWLVWGRIPDGYTLNLHPMAFAAWFGMLATALNLFPVGQLDGGHISYAVFGRNSSRLTIASIIVAIILTSFFSRSLLAPTVLMLAMTLIMGPHHPRTLDEHVPLDRTRMWLAVTAAIIFGLCFTPNPIETTQLLK